MSQLEAIAAASKADEVMPAKTKKQKPALSAELSELEGRIRETMGVRATLTGTVKKGKIVLQYYSQEELEHLNDLLLRLEE